MQISNLPATKLAVPFASSAGGGYIRTIPQASQIGISDGAASLTDGFPPLNFQPVGSGGVPPDGRDMNGILSEITAWTRWQNAGGLVPYDSAFSTAIGGYPQSALLAGTTLGTIFLSTADNNTTNPNSGGAGWLPVATGASVQSGQYVYAIAGGTANALTATLAPAPAALTVGMAIRLAITAANTGAATLNVNGLGALPIKTRVNNAIQSGDLPLGALVDFEYNGTAWQLAGIAYSEVPIVASSLTFYVRADGNDANNGLTNTSAGAFATIAAAITASQTKYFIPPNGLVTIQLGIDGVYAAPNAVSIGSGQVRIVGNTADRTTRQISTAVTGSNSLIALQSGNLSLSYVQMNNTGSSGYSASSSGSSILSLDNVIFQTPSAATSGIIWAAGNSTIVIGANVFINGSAGYALLAFPGSILLNSNMTISAAFSSAVADAQGGGKIQFSQAGLTVSGSTTGKRYIVDSNGIINTGGGGANVFPGSIAGTTSNGGIYL